MSSALRCCLPTDAWVRFLIVPVLVFVALITDRNYLSDFWHHLARGRAMVEQGQLVDQDLFTFTVPGREFQDVNWLTQVLYFFLYDRGGLELVQLVNALILAVTLALLVNLCRRRSGSLVVASGVGITVFFGLWQVLTIRPQTFSLLLFVVMLHVLERAERRPWLLALPPVLIALWANLHGAFPAGIMLIGCFLAASAWQAWRGGRLRRDRQTQRLGWCLFAAMAATLLNPYGWNIYYYVGLTSNTAALRRIDEWVPPTLDLWIGKAWLISMVVVATVLVWQGIQLRQWPTARDVIFMACFLPLACRSARMVAWWLLICAPLLAQTIVRLWPQRLAQTEPPPPARGPALVVAAMALFVVFSLPGLQRFNPLLLARQGPRVEHDLDAIRAELAGHVPAARIFSRFEWGEYMSWSYAPAHKVFMDGRIEIFPDDVWEHYAAVTCGKPQWRTILDEYRVDALILDAGYHARTGLLPHVEQSTAWQRVFQSRDALLYLRRTPLYVSRAHDPLSR